MYAIGECTEHAGVTYGLVAPAWEQATVLAGLLTGTQPQGRYRGSKLYARLKVAGVEVASFGELEPSLETDRSIQIVEEREFAYRKLVLRGRQLVGAMFVGNVSNAATLVQTFDRGDPLPEDPLEALCNIVNGSSGGGDRTICNCFKVTESAIVACVKDGAESADDGDRTNQSRLRLRLMQDRSRSTRSVERKAALGCVGITTQLDSDVPLAQLTTLGAVAA